MNRVVGLLCTLVVLASANFAQENIVAVHPASTAPRCAHGKAVVQKPAPFFDADAVVNGEFKRVKLTDFQGKYLILFFYPMDFTYVTDVIQVHHPRKHVAYIQCRFVCPTEIIAFNDRVKEFREINAELAAVSIDSKFVHLAWVKTPRVEGGIGNVTIPLISDLSRRISRDYGVLIEDGPDEGVALRGLFIINEVGVVRQITINDLPVGRSVDEVLRLVKAFQYSDVHGEVCPADWTPGASTIKPSPEDCKVFFKDSK